MEEYKVKKEAKVKGKEPAVNKALNQTELKKQAALKKKL